MTGANEEAVSAEENPTRLWRRPMVARSSDEEHRVSTPLELLFDLCFVVAVSQVGIQLDHSLAAGDLRTGIVGYLTVFFAIWWAWVNFTWFASAYDTDDVPYRLFTFLQIAGALVLAAGVPQAFRSGNFVVITAGYVLLRVAMIAQWVRAGWGDVAGRAATRRYAIGIAMVQAGWVGRLFLTRTESQASFYALAFLEMTVPVWAERRGRSTSWHPEHISERYGLFTLIVLGESVSAATIAIQSAVSSQGLSASLCEVAAGGLLIAFGMWWWYFDHPSEEGLRLSPKDAYTWGYGHYGVFVSAAALGAGLQVAVESVRSGGRTPAVTAGLAIAFSVAVFLSVTSALHRKLSRSKVSMSVVVAVCAVVLLIGSAADALSLPLAIPLIGVVVASLVGYDVYRSVTPPAS